MPRKYFTLAARSPGQPWSPQFGDYSRRVVKDELEDTRGDWERGTRFRIIETDDTQAAINAAIDELNKS